MKIADGYVTDGTGPERVQQVIRVDPVGDHHHGRVRCGAADPAGRFYSVADNAASHEADLGLLALG